MQLTNEEMSTARIALIAWSHRCSKEAKVQRELAKEVPSMAEKAEANALASERFKAEADALAEKIKTYRRYS